MSKFIWMHGALALAMSFPAWAASDADLAEIREQIRQLKESYEARIQALEQKLKDAETAKSAPAAATTTAAAARISFTADFVEAYLDRGFAYGQLGEFDRAVADFTKVLELQPKSYKAYALRGAARMKMLDFKNAVDDFSGALAANSSDVYL